MKFKRSYLTYIVFAVCSILAIIQTVSAVPVVDVGPSYPGVSPGEMFMVNITIDPDGTEFLGASYNLYFNNSILEAQSQNKGPFLGQDGASTTVIKNEINNTAGRVEYGEMRTGVSSGVTDPGILATINFTVIGYGVDDFRLYNVELMGLDSDQNCSRISDIIVQSRPSSDFIIDGYVFNEDGTECTYPTVKLTNINIGMERKASNTNENSNYYRIIMVVGGVDVIAGDVLRLNVISRDGNQSKVKDHTVTEDEIENGGIFNFNFTLAPDTTLPADNNDRTGTSSGSSGGSGSSGEDFENIVISETEREYVNKGVKICYQFNTEGNVVQYINFTGLTNSGQVVAKVEILDHTSALVEHPPADIVYKDLNIWVGNLGWASSKNIANPTVNFKVEKTWVNDNNIDRSSIKLNRYTEQTWNQLVTTLIGEDEDYIYFNAETSGFSPFAITGKKTVSSGSGDSEMDAVAGSGAMEEEPVQVPDQTPAYKVPGFNLFVCLLMLLTTAKILYKK